jgi:hypothetical protein
MVGRTANVITTNFPVQIVTCVDGVEVDALLKEHGVTPRHRYRYALNGFAAPPAPLGGPVLFFSTAVCSFMLTLHLSLKCQPL